MRNKSEDDLYKESVTTPSLISYKECNWTGVVSPKDFKPEKSRSFMMLFWEEKFREFVFLSLEPFFEDVCIILCMFFSLNMFTIFLYLFYLAHIYMDKRYFET